MYVLTFPDQGSHQVTFFETSFPEQNFFLYFLANKKPIQKISVANISDNYQEHFCMKKVVAKKEIGRNPA